MCPKWQWDSPHEAGVWAHRCGEGLFVWRGEQRGGISRDFWKVETNVLEEKKEEEEKRLGKLQRRRGRVLGWYMASLCCCCGRWWPVISVLSLSDRPDNQWALLDGAGAKPLTPPWSTPSPSAVRVCVCLCVHTHTHKAEKQWVTDGEAASTQLQRELHKQECLITDTAISPSMGTQTVKIFKNSLQWSPINQLDYCGLQRRIPCPFHKKQRIKGQETNRGQKPCSLNQTATSPKDKAMAIKSK